MLSSNKQQLAIYSNSTAYTTQIKDILPSLVLQANYTPNGIILKTTRNNIRALASVLRYSGVTQATILSDIAATDKLDKVGRFAVKYNFLSVKYNRRVIVEVFSDETLSIPSLAAPFLNEKKLFASAG